jgi:hypothetical protein
MATIGPVQLTVTPNLDNRVVNVSYTITFSAFDKTTNLPYSQVVRLFGDDTSVAGDPISAAPDDVILGGVLAVNTVQANGQNSLAVTLTRTLGKSSLNEDTGIVPNPDEIRAKVTLAPALPSVQNAESNLYTESIS